MESAVIPKGERHDRDGERIGCAERQAHPQGLQIRRVNTREGTHPYER